MISTCIYDFHGDFFPKLLDFYDKFHYVTNNIAIPFMKKIHIFFISKIN
jgi:hypothetical protein